MTRYVAFLRGMNVGGHRISNAELCAAFDEIGLPGASTFRASGNVIFDMPDGGGTIDSDLDLQAIAKLIGGLTTMRTKGTIELIAAKFCSG